MNTALKPLIPALLLSLGLTACGGGGGGTSTAPGTQPVPTPTPIPNPVPTPTPSTDACVNLPGDQTAVPPGYIQEPGNICTLKDACINYEGDQTLAQVQQAEMQRIEATGECRMIYNHEDMAFINADWARIHGYQGQGQTLAVVDLYTRQTHVELYPRVIGGYNYTNEGGPFDIDTNISYEQSWDAHGLLVSSIAAGRHLGVAKDISIFHNRAGTQNKDMAKAILDSLQARSHKVINVSNTFGVESFLYQKEGNDVYGILAPLDQNNGILVFAAGNYHDNISEVFDRVAQYGASSNLMDARYKDNSIYVVTFNMNQQDIPYSSYPGWRPEFYQRFITVTADSLVRADAQNDTALTPEGLGGTSSAAPQVSAAILILMSINPNLTAPQAAQILLDTARRDLPEYRQTCTDKTDMGTFTVNCGHMKYGMGIMDLKAAIQKAQTL
jgi:hypothetical protein